MVNDKKKTRVVPMLPPGFHSPLKIPVVSGMFIIRKKTMTAAKEVRSLRVEKTVPRHYRKTEQYQQKEKTALMMKQTLNLNLHPCGNGTREGAGRKKELLKSRHMIPTANRIH